MQFNDLILFKFRYSQTIAQLLFSVRTTMHCGSLDKLLTLTRLNWFRISNSSMLRLTKIWIETTRHHYSMFHHGLFTNGWETRSCDMWKPVSNQTRGIISKICKLGGGTPALLTPVGTLQILHGLILGKWLQLDKMKKFFQIYAWCLLYFSERSRLAWLWVSLDNFSFMLLWWSFQVRALHNFHSWDTISK